MHFYLEVDGCGKHHGPKAFTVHDNKGQYQCVTGNDC